MINMNVDLFFEPIDILDRVDDVYAIEMSKEQEAFLCGLIKKHRPKKIVEIGVAAGGTTAVVLNCLSMLDLNAQMFSIDLSTDYYRDNSKKTGYLIEECKSRLNRKMEHTLYTGKFAVEYLEEIGKDIDFLILDTVHSLPGEMLDFLACYPFLRKGSIIVLHDIAMNHYVSDVNSFATKLLFDTVVAEKYIEMRNNDVFPNIGAFMINDDTDKYIDNVFSALTITWSYIPQEQELYLYKDFYEKYYTHESVKLFNEAIRLNRETYVKNQQTKIEWFTEAFTEAFKEVFGWSQFIKDKRIYIYGCGYFGKKLYGLLEQIGGEIELAGYIVSDGQKKTEMKENVYYLSEIDLESDKDMIFVGVRSSLQEEICAELRKKGFAEYIIPSDKLLMTI